MANRSAIVSWLNQTFLPITVSEAVLSGVVRKLQSIKQCPEAPRLLVPYTVSLGPLPHCWFLFSSITKHSSNSSHPGGGVGGGSALATPSPPPPPLPHCASLGPASAPMPRAVSLFFTGPWVFFKAPIRGLWLFPSSSPNPSSMSRSASLSGLSLPRVSTWEARNKYFLSSLAAAL